MKPVDSHLNHASISTFALPDSQIRQRYSSLMERLFAPTQAPDESNFSYTSEGFRCRLSKDEAAFYEENYLRLSPAVPFFEGHGFAQYFGKAEYERLMLGENEHKVLEFLEHREKKNHYLIGGVGSGKSTLLRYVMLYVIPQSEALNEYWPIYIRLDRTRLDETKTREDFSSVLLRELRQILSRILNAEVRGRRINDLHNEDFWMFVQEQDGFSSLKNKVNLIKDKANLVGGSRVEHLSQSSAWDELCNARIECSSLPELGLAAVRYVGERLGLKPVLFIDNVEPMNGEQYVWLTEELFSIRSRYHVKTVTTMRRTTWEQVKEIQEGTTNSHVQEIGEPDLVAYTTSKAEKLIALVGPAKAIIASPTGIRGAFQAAELLPWAINGLLQGDCMKLLNATANGNLRRWHDVAGLYLSSGWLEQTSDQLGQSLKEALDSGKNKGAPGWLALRALITRNHRTCFGTRSEKFHNLVVNPYCNGPGHNRYLIRLQLLSFIARRGRTRASDLEVTYTDLFAHHEQVAARAALGYALLRLVNCELLASSKRHTVRSLDSIGDLGDLTITVYGRLWLDELIAEPGALAYLKDDVWFGSIPQGMNTCLDDRNFRERLMSSLVFLEAMCQSETEFLHNLPDKVKPEYLGNFTKAITAPMFYLWIVRHLREYVDKRRHHQSETDHPGDYSEIVNRFDQIEKVYARWDDGIRRIE